MKITMQKITDAIASAGPKKEGEKWEAEPIARSIANLIENEVTEEKQKAADVEARLARQSLRFVPSGVVAGSATDVQAWQDELVAKHRALVDAKIAQNKAVVGTVGATIVSLGTAALTGGATTPALVTGLLGIANTIRDALNDQAA